MTSPTDEITNLRAALDDIRQHCAHEMKHASANPVYAGINMLVKGLHDMAVRGPARSQGRGPRNHAITRATQRMRRCAYNGPRQVKGRWVDAHPSSRFHRAAAEEDARSIIMTPSRKRRLAKVSSPMSPEVRAFFDCWMASIDAAALITDHLRAEHAYYRAKGYELHHEPGIGLVWERSPFLYQFNAP